MNWFYLLHLYSLLLKINLPNNNILTYSLIQKNGYTFATVYSNKCVSVFLHQTLVGKYKIYQNVSSTWNVLTYQFWIPWVLNFCQLWGHLILPVKYIKWTWTTVSLTFFFYFDMKKPNFYKQYWPCMVSIQKIIFGKCNFGPLWFLYKLCVKYWEENIQFSFEYPVFKLFCCQYSLTFLSLFLLKFNSPYLLQFDSLKNQHKKLPIFTLNSILSNER